jgi:thiol-disulfide isomerase/thioredoxin
MSNEPETKSRRSLGWFGLLTLALVLLGASLYAFGGFGNLFGGGKGAVVAQCTAAKDRVGALKPLAVGEVAALQVPDSPAPVTPLTFLNDKGEAVTLEAFRGRTILLNLWATWCVPCRKEMPALDALQGALGGADFAVVAVNIDTRNFEKPKTFLGDIKVSKLDFYSDPKAKIFQDLKAAGRAFGMPTTLLIDPSGCELAYLAGPAEWASPEALAFVKTALSR